MNLTKNKTTKILCVVIMLTSFIFAFIHYEDFDRGHGISLLGCFKYLSQIKASAFVVLTFVCSIISLALQFFGLNKLSLLPDVLGLVSVLVARKQLIVGLFGDTDNFYEGKASIGFFIILVCYIALIAKTAYTEFIDSDADSDDSNGSNTQ